MINVNANEMEEAIKVAGKFDELMKKKYSRYKMEMKNT